ncbi:DUF2232 domain-containing protein [Azospirillaceae bacterium]
MSPALIAVGCGALSALLYLSVVVGSVGGFIFGYLAPLPLTIAGLALGPFAVILGGVCGTIIVAVINVAWLDGSWLGPFLFAATGALPLSFLIRNAMLSRTTPDGSLEWYPPGLLAVMVSGFGVLGFAIALLLTLDEVGGLHGVLTRLLLSIIRQAPIGAEPIPNRHDVIEGLAQILPGAVVASWSVMLVLNGVLAQSVVARFNRCLRPPIRLSDLELPGWTPLAFALSSAGAVILPDDWGFVALNLTLIIALMFLFAGLAVVHAYARNRPTKVLILTLFYISFILLAWPPFAVVGLGVLEQWIGLRRRFSASGPDQEI